MKANTEQVIDQGKSEDELWAQVNQDRATRAAGEDEQPTPATADKDDPLSALPEPTRKLIQEMDEKVRKSEEQVAILDRKFGTANGIIGNLKQRLDESQAKLSAVEPIISAADAAKKAAAEVDANERVQRRKATREAVAEISPEFVEFVDMAVADVAPAQREVKPDKPAEQAPNAAEEVRVLKLELELSDKAPGWRTTKNTTEFREWLAAQPKEFQDKTDSTWDVDELASVFAGFEKHKKDAVTISQVEKDRKERLSRGSSIQGRGSSVGNVDLTADAAWEKVKRDREKSRAST